MILCLAVSLFPRPAAALEEDEPEAAAATPRCTMAVAERQRGEAGFSIRLELTGELPEDSAVYVSRYTASGQMAELVSLDPAEEIAVTFADAAETDTVKVFWLSAQGLPLCAAREVSAHIPAIFFPADDDEHFVWGEFGAEGDTWEAQYADHQLILFTEDGVASGQVRAMAEAVGADVVGCIEAADCWLLEFPAAQSLPTLNDLAAQLASQEGVDSASLNMVSALDPQASYYPNDTYGVSETWNEGFPNGSNWGYEAVNAASARNILKEHFGASTPPRIPVCILDSTFCTDCNDWPLIPGGDLMSVWGANSLATDLKKLAAETDDLKLYNIRYAHGTHVAGIIGARTGNNAGISGVALNARLILCELAKRGSAKNKYASMIEVSSFHRMCALALVLEKAGPDRTAVINYSVGITASKEAKQRQAAMQEAADCTKLLQGYRAKGYDFVIVTAAGNGESALKDALYANGFTAVTEKDLYDRIVVVGSAENSVHDASEDPDLPYFKISENYNTGDRIDVLAPGDKIRSTVPPNSKPAQGDFTGSNGNSWKDMSGTSQATPFVSGIAALILSTDPDLPGDRVKALLVETADIPVEGSGKKMVNAEYAVLKALGLPRLYRGVCGNNDTITWTFDPVGGRLTVTGSGSISRSNDDGSTMPWYRYRGGITSVVMESGITAVGDYAFQYCPRLKEAAIPDSVTWIREGAFQSCTALEEVRAEGALYIQKYAFRGCSALGSVHWGAKLNAIRDSAFEDCESLTEVSAFPASLTTVEPSAFLNTGLTELHFLCRGTLSAVSDADRADASFPDGATLFYPPDLKSSWDPNSTKLWKGYKALPESAVLCGTVLNARSKEPIKGASVLVRNHLEDEFTAVTAADGSFSLVLTDNAPLPVSVEISAGGYVSAAQTARMEENLLNLAPVELEPLPVVNLFLLLPDGTPAAGMKITGTGLSTDPTTDSNGLVRFSVHPGDYIFEGLVYGSGSGIDTPRYYLDISRTITGDLNETITLSTAEFSWSFDEGSGLLSVWGSGPMPNIQFQSEPWNKHLPDITAINISGLTTIGSWAFNNAAASWVSIPDSVRRIGDGAFIHCHKLEQIHIPDSVTEIGEQAFYNSGLTGIVIPDSVTTIGREAFAGWYGGGGSALTEVTIGRGVRSIGYQAFFYAPKLTSVTILGNVESCGTEVFHKCDSLTDVEIGSDVKILGGLSGAESLTGLILPDSITAIGNGAFYGCTGLTSLTIPGNVLKVGTNAFGECTGLTAVTLSPGVERIGNSAFYSCTGLTSMSFPAGLKSIGKNAFKDCSGLRALQFGEGLISIDEYAFSGCGALKELSFPATLRRMGQFVFEKNTTIEKAVFTSEKLPTLGIRLFGFNNGVQVYYPASWGELSGTPFSHYTWIPYAPGEEP